LYHWHMILSYQDRESTKTLQELQEFYWPGSNNFVLTYVSSCDLCQRNVSKGTVGKAPLGSLPVIGTPFSVICIDLRGPLSPPSDGNRWIVTIIDMCTQFPGCIPLKDISSSSVAEVFLGVFSRVGLPDRIHSDRGSQFTSEMMQEIYRLLSVKQSTTSPYHAMGNGLCENMNKTVKNLLKKVVSERQQDWLRYITPLMFAVRDTPQDSTGFYSEPQCSHCKRCTSYGISVCLSICPSVTRRYCVKTTAHSTVQFALSDSKMCPVL